MADRGGSSLAMADRGGSSLAMADRGGSSLAMDQCPLYAGHELIDTISTLI